MPETKEHMHHYDAELLKQIQELEQKLEALRQSLYTPGHGCICSYDRVCSFHAGTNNYLVDATEALNMAARELVERRD